MMDLNEPSAVQRPSTVERRRNHQLSDTEYHSIPVTAMRLKFGQNALRALHVNYLKQTVNVKFEATLWRSCNRV